MADSTTREEIESIRLKCQLSKIYRTEADHLAPSVEDIEDYLADIMSAWDIDTGASTVMEVGEHARQIALVLQRENMAYTRDVREVLDILGDHIQKVRSAQKVTYFLLALQAVLAATSDRYKMAGDGPSSAEHPLCEQMGRWIDQLSKEG
jgi:hypothetical protein